MTERACQPGCQSHSVEITNRTDSPIMVYIEPWGDEIDLQPREQMRVDIIGPGQKPVAVSYLVGSIVVEGWQGTTAEAWKGSERVN
jgi:hypothetical protein